MVIQNLKKKPLHKASKKVNIKYSFYAVLIALILISFVVVPTLYTYSILNKANSIAISSISLSLIFSFISFSYFLTKGYTLKESIKELGLEKRKITFKYVVIGIVLFFVFFIGEIIASIISNVFNVGINTNVQAVTNGLPVYFFIFIIIIAPINEEIFFRGLLCPRIGIFASALIFGLMHYLSYFSIAEFIAAFVFGIAAGYIFIKTSSLYSSIIGHMLFDLINIAIIILI
ncbi:MAG: type II CAAX endopeptidase family protein [Candidatus Micrarchaeaceae archaeon]